MRAVAIDGPTGAGKSTMARLLAKSLGYVYVDTGALYRAVGYGALKKGVDVSDEQAVSAALPEMSVDIRYSGGEQSVFLDEEDVGGQIRSEEVSMAASAVSAFPAVRAFLLKLQKDIAARGDVIMDGRDIGTVILPGADLKIFLTASPEDRAARRYEELRSKGAEADYEDVLRDLKTRDYNDSHRETAPLKPAEDAVVVDTTGNELSVSVEILTNLVKEKLLK